MPEAQKSAGRESGPNVEPIAVDQFDEAQLLEGLRRSDEAHFRELYDRYFKRIYAFVYARIRNHSEAEEIVQETFMAVFGSLENFRGQSSLLAWIYGIARNTLNNTLRKNRVRATRMEEYALKQVDLPISVTHCSPADQLEINRCASAIESRLESVAGWQSEIFRMRHVEDLSIREICKRTNRSSDSVRSSLYRVKHLLVEASGLDAIVPSDQATKPAEAGQ